MSEWDNSNSGALFKENKKSDSHPDYKGKAGFDGTQHWASGWVKSEGEDKYLSLSFQEVDGSGAGSGRLTRNSRKNSERHPDFVGTASLDGTEYSLAGWKRTARTSGKEFISLKAEPPRDAPQKQEPAAASVSSGVDDDEIPF